MSDHSPSTAELKDQPQTASGLLVPAILAIAIPLVGWLVCGTLIDNFGRLGAIGLWGLGTAVAMAHRRVRPIDKSSALILSVALVLAFCLAEIYWIQNNIVDAESFTNAAKVFPTFLSEYKLDAFVAGIFTVFGIGNFWQRP